jgi:hypothetical protein
MSDQIIKCPNCGNDIEINRAIKNKIQQEARKEMEKALRDQIERETKTEVLDLQNALREKEQKVEQLRDQELKIREEKRKIEEREKELVLEVQRKIDEERKRVEEKITKQMIDDHRLKDSEKDKKISDLMKSLEEAQRKAQQGSQQTQGEILELDIEIALKTAFPQDQIEPVGKGVEGADVRQIVKSPKGYVCGVILWEGKQTKTWQDKWLLKLKDDLRAEKANVPVIITSTFPKGAQNMALREGVWICSYELITTLAVLLRKNLLDIAQQRAFSEYKGEKADLLYEYIVGHEFRQQVEALVEIYQEMHSHIAKERIVFEKSWKVRESQIRRLISSTVNVYGGIQGLLGSSMPQIKGLELLELEEGAEDRE